ncbi:MAG: NAD-dependent DNA ligase LigA, partial [Patescibacteria group bacterium]
MQDKQQIEKRIEKLKKEINYHRYAYHVLDKLEISDAVLDSLKNELQQLEQQYPKFITLDSPTQRVGGLPLEKFQKVQHSAPMISLFDAFSQQDMIDWQKRLEKILITKDILQTKQKTGVDYYCELKMDGLAVALIYEQGKFVLGATRGDGEVGENVTQNLKTIEAIPLILRRPEKSELIKIGLTDESIEKLYQVLEYGKFEARGEAIMPNNVFVDLNKKYKKQGRSELANPRNAAAGSIRQLDSKLTAERKLDCHIYSLATDLGLMYHEQEHELAKLLGFKVLKQNKYCKNLEETIKFHDYWEKHRDEVLFDCDGVVIVVNNLSLWEELGVVGKGPRYIMAYKFAAEQATTILEDVVWQVGRTGVLTPTAHLKPVQVYGVVISRATLHNMDEIKRLGLKINDTVVIERAGDVIPKIVKVLTGLRQENEKEINEPKKCPNCGGVVIKKPGEVAYRCINKDCYAINLRNLTHWASKNAIDIDGLGPKIIEQLMKQKLVKDISDFYQLTIGDLKPLERFAEKSAKNLIKAIAVKKQVELLRFLFGLGICHVGEETALLLTKQLGIRNQELRIRELIDYFKNLTLEDLEKLPDVGPIVAKSIYDWFHDKHNIELLLKLEKNGLTVKTQITDHSSSVARKLSGKIFVLTGALSNLTRDEAKVKIRELGGDISSSVSKNTSYVIAGADPGSKFNNAKKLGVKIINEKEFSELIS